MSLSESQRRWLKWVGYPVFSLVALLFALHHTFPYHRVEEKIVAWGGEELDVKVGEIRRGLLPGNIIIENLSLETRPDREGEQPTLFMVNRLDLQVGLLSLIGGTFHVDAVADVGAGKIKARVRLAKSLVVQLRTEELPLATIPGLKSATGGLPLEGGLNGAVSLRVPIEKRPQWSLAEGVIELGCDGCTAGDGVSKVVPPSPKQQDAFSKEGYTLPRLRLGKFRGKLVVAKGVGRTEGFEAHSPDGDLILDAEIRFQDEFAKSEITGFMRYRFSDELKQRELQLRLSQVEPMADGYSGVRIGPGPLTAAEFRPSKVPPRGFEDKVRGLASSMGGPGRGSGPVRSSPVRPAIPRPGMNPAAGGSPPPPAPAMPPFTTQPGGSPPIAPPSPPPSFPSPADREPPSIEPQPSEDREGHGPPPPPAEEPERPPPPSPPPRDEPVAEPEHAPAPPEEAPTPEEP